MIDKIYSNLCFRTQNLMEFGISSRYMKDLPSFLVKPKIHSFKCLHDRKYENENEQILKLKILHIRNIIMFVVIMYASAIFILTAEIIMNTIKKKRSNNEPKHLYNQRIIKNPITGEIPIRIYK